MHAIHRIAFVMLLVSCDAVRSPAKGPAFAESKGLVMLNAVKKELSFSATFHKLNAEQGSWSLIVESEGEMASRAFFTTDVSPAKFHESLKALGAVDGNNVNAANFNQEDIATRGDEIEFLFDWKGQKEPLPLSQLVREAVPDLPSSGGERGIEMRFGGNYTLEDAAAPPCNASGCLASLYTCSAAVTSNAKANHALLRKEKNAHRYRWNPAVPLEDGARVRVYVRRK